MAKIRLENLQTGMTLAEDAKDNNGRLLLPKGTTLTGQHIQSLKSRGVADVVVTDSGKPASDIDPKILEEAKEYFCRFFVCTDINHEAMEEIFRISSQRLARRLSEGWKISRWEETEIPVHKRTDIFKKEQWTPQDLVKHEVELASFPDIYFRIQEVIKSPTSSAKDIAEVVSKDTSLSAKLLKLVNSPFYGFANKIESISRAITLIGAKELSTLAMGISAINAFKDIPPELMDMKRFWEHSITCGTYAKSIAIRVKHMPIERFFVAGMLHDIGRLILFKKLPYAATEALLYSRANAIPLYEAEKDIFGFDHTAVSSLLLKEWKLPTVLVELIQYHHAPLSAPDKTGASILHLADILANSFQLTAQGTFFIPPLNENAWDILGLTPSDMQPIVQEGDEQIQGIINAFFG